MSRTQKQGIDYFPFDVDFFSDTKIKILVARYGTAGIAILQYLLCLIYREGYYTKVTEDTYYVISAELHTSVDTVRQVLKFLLERSMFDDTLFRSDTILTSTRIQETWQKAVSARATKTKITVSKYWLLKSEETKPFINCTLFDDNSEKKDDNSEKYSQSKVKYITTLSISENPEISEIEKYVNEKGYHFSAEKFYLTYSSVDWMNKGAKITDWKKLADKWEIMECESKKKKPSYSNKTSTSDYAAYDLDAFEKMINGD